MFQTHFDRLPNAGMLVSSDRVRGARTRSRPTSREWRRPTLSVIAGVVALAAATLVRADESARGFAYQVQPVLSDKCFSCHGPDEEKRPTDLRLDREAGVSEAFAGGDFSQSEAWRRITSTDPELMMPPPGQHKPFTRPQLEAVRGWMSKGSQWSPHWAFVAPEKLEPPRGFAEHPIDAFVRRRLAAGDLVPAPRASKEKLLRRATLDLHGLPPTLGEIDAFVADDSREAWDRVLDRLLASPRYGERMAVAWLDGARYADTNGYQNDFSRTMWPWRDWVIDAFNKNMPFDRFAIEQLAGDLLPDATDAQRLATAFNRNNRTVTEGGSISEEWRVENVIDRVETTSAVFLGLTMGCARCHDHKFDPITQEEFYGFFAFFNSVDELGVYNEARGNVGPVVECADDAQRVEMARLEERVAEQARLLESLQKKEQGDEAARLAAPSDIDSVAADGDAKLAPREGARLVAELRAQLEAAQREADDYRKTVPTCMVMQELPQPRQAYVLKRGEYDKADPGRPVSPAVPAFLGRLPTGRNDRLALAKWITARDNPLTARVVVNRLWSRFFGQGLVKTEENFGVQSDPPSHPDLLDWLAVELIDSGWDLRHAIRLIMTSETYRQSSAVAAEQYASDPTNATLARGPRHRLQAEFVRDNALSISGLLAPRIGGPSVFPYQPEGLWDELAGGANQGPYTQATDEGLYRRSLYTYRKRTVPHPTMTTFDSPSFEVCTVKRTITNTPLQALALLNDTTYVETARELGARMLKEGGDDKAARVRFGFRLCTSRDPSAEELGLLVKALDKYHSRYQGDQDAAELLLKVGASPAYPSTDPPELAAYASLGSLLLNLDETISVE
ncbi:Planctomycete cytochrome C [Pirellulimonas nuda]|uniref:Planctomycete cytochrome C n=1 Tax=Pirellulimonas nuda TaxID=2528009 RepID=A0A518DCX3_9BACT|nr:PSD1 and planctomycete cytochrome C domain-containing protein [Pirellulimonas nuda]QDU89276.1 Planctomycete cytochrome C [Pirellulimonas nuda]